MARKSGPSTANTIRKRLSVLFNYAIRLDLLRHNPTRLADKRKENAGGFHTWTDAEISKFRAQRASGTLPRLAMELALNTGAARQDLVKLGWQNVSDGRIAYRRGKTGIEANLPILDELAAELGRVPQNQLLLIQNLQKKGYTPKSVGAWFRKCCDSAGLKNCTLHGLRKAGATRLASAGATENEIAALLAHKNT